MTWLDFAGPVILVPPMTIKDNPQTSYRHPHRSDYQIWKRRRDVRHSWQRKEDFA